MSESDGTPQKSNELNLTEDVLRYIAMERVRENEQDKAIRNHPAMRVAAYKIVRQIGEMLEDYAAEPARALHGKNWINPFIQDDIRNELLWLVQEFMCYSMIDRTDEFYQDLPRSHQFGEYHCSWFFGVSVNRRKLGDHETETPTADDEGHIWHQK